MLPSVVKDLSGNRSRAEFHKVPSYKSRLIWKKAQTLQQHLYRCEEIFVFTNFRFLEEGHKEITNMKIHNHCDAYKNSKTFSDFKKRTLFYIYDSKFKECECKDFWLYSFCKHSLAAMIYFKEIEVMMN